MFFLTRVGIISLNTEEKTEVAERRDRICNNGYGGKNELKE